MLPTLVNKLFAAVAQGSRFLITCFVNFQGRSLGSLNFLPVKKTVKNLPHRALEEKKTPLVFFFLPLVFVENCTVF